MPNEDTIFLKSSVDVLGFFDVEQLRKITPDIERQTYKQDETVLFKGQITEGFYIIKKGGVVVTKKDAKGAKTTASLAAGDFFGEMSVLEDISSAESVKASEGGTEILTIPHASFEKLTTMMPLLKQSLQAKITARAKAPPKPG